MSAMLIPALLALQVVTKTPDTATYASDALRQLVAEASRLNSQVPATLGRYRANLESEISYGGRAGDREMSVSFEQTASTLDWKRDGSFEQHLVGYRSQSIGPSMATIGFFRSSWAVPALYGNRLSLLFGTDSTRSGPARARARANARTSTPYVAVHPLAVDRERYYRFTGGDTVLELRVDNREIRIARVDVTPRPDVPAGTYFTGEVDVDVERRHVVRMRGSFVSNRRPGSVSGVARLLQFDAIAYVELVNAEVEGQYWLPSFQRFEGHALASTVTSSTAIFRIVSRFRDYIITPPGPQAGVAEEDTLRPRPHRLSRAGPDSMAQFREWRDEIGAVTATVAASDFDSVAPPRWRPFGPPVVIAQVERFSDFMRFNRVEGLFTGLGFTARMRDLAPGVTVRGTAGYAWSEGTVRGRLTIEKDRATRGTFKLSAGRSLDPTNDFLTTFDSTTSFGPLFGVDNADYVDRRYLSASNVAGATRGRIGLSLDLALVDDRNARVNVTHSPFGGPNFFANRHVDEKRYTRATYTLQYNPLVQAEYMRPGIGVTLRHQEGLQFYRRTTLGFNARTNQGRWTIATRFDAGAVHGIGDTPVPFDSAGSPKRFQRGMIPTQHLFEMGGASSLPGYEYKEFAGNQMALLRGIVMFRLNILQSPIRFGERMWLPEPSPALSFSIQSGWTGTSNQEARDAVARLGPRFLSDTLALASYAPASTLMGNARTTVAVGVRFFGGTIGVVLARPIDRAAPWKLQLAAGQLF
jgi:hypothetical protein